MHAISANLIASLRLIGYIERKGSSTFTNFIINKNPKIEICVHKRYPRYYIINNSIFEDDTYIESNSLNNIIKLDKNEPRK